MTPGDVLARYLGAFVDELVASGLRDVCLCPGSRSTPLALTFARHPRVTLWTHLDERSCAYFALGMAKVRPDKPVAILCSSGTAAANFAPAVVEAFHAHVPLLVLTADRPQELRDLGSNQTIEQNRLYGAAAKWFVEMPLPESSDEALRYVRMVADRAIATAQGGAPGPVHLNFPFREPLVPSAYDFAPESTPPITSASASAGATAVDASLADALRRSERGLIVLGPDSGVDAGAIVRLADRLGLPVLADALSNVRNGPWFEPHVLGAYDAFLRDAGIARELRPDLVLRFGVPPTSKPLATYLALHRDARQVVVAPPGVWPDPDLTASDIVYAGPSALDLESITDSAPRRANGWLEAWQRAETAALDATTRVLDSEARASEPSVIADLAAVLPEGWSVFAGNSMPVRDLDSFFPASAAPHAFYANRGASGIDGVVSSALGAAAVLEGRVVLVIGDLSFYHDMNGLLAAQRFGLSATIILVNNDGGGIFSFLPQNDQTPDEFEALFGTPHGLDFRPVAQLYGLGWRSATTRDEYRAALAASIAEPGVSVVEVRTDRNANLALHRRIWREVAPAVSGVVAK